MSSPLLVLGLLLGLDSLAVGAALGAVTPERLRRWRLALAFGLCDGLASFAGWAAGAAEWRDSFGWCEWLGPAAVGGYGLYVLSLAWRTRWLAGTGADRWLALGLPLGLSLDNLAAGVGTDASGGSAALAALALGAASGCLALFGLGLGAGLAARVRLRAEWLGGAALLVVALALVCKEAMS